MKACEVLRAKPLGNGVRCGGRRGWEPSLCRLDLPVKTSQGLTGCMAVKAAACCGHDAVCVYFTRLKKKSHEDILNSLAEHHCRPSH